MKVDEKLLVVIDYTNHRGERKRRTILPLFVHWGKNEWHREEQYLLHAFDVEINAHRDFAMKDIHKWIAP
jgi:predicted DNA-binding transcriptional regulator YafY